MTRKATSEDIGFLVTLLKELFTQEVEFVYDEQVQYNAVKKLLNSPNLGDIFVIEDDNKVVGMVVLLYTFSTALGETVAILEDMIINSEYCNRGFGSQLLKYAVNIAKSQNIKRITLLTDKLNDKAHKFYKENDFLSSSMIPFRRFI
jgi:N-acetylglutamate synthase-like GNAT family acetyltransferase